MTKIGTAYIDVDGDFSQFDRGVDQRVAALKAKFGAVGSSAGDDFARNFTRSVGNGSALAPLERDVDRTAQRIGASGSKAGKDFGDGIGKGMSDGGRAAQGFQKTASDALAAASASAQRAAGDFEQVARAQDAVAEAAHRVTAADLQREQAALNVAKAEDTLNEVSKRGEATANQRQQASLNVAKAQHALASADNTATRAHRDQVKAADDLTRAMGNVERGATRDAHSVGQLATAAGGSGGGFSRAARALDDFGGAGAGASATLGGLRIALAAVIPVAIGFGGAAISVGAALAPLIGLAAAAGNAVAAAAQGFGVFKLATSGIAEALKEQTAQHVASGGAATNDAGSQRAAGRAIASAQDGVRSATDALATAQQNAKQAQAALSGARTEAARALVDMHASLEDAITGEQRAILTLQDAKNELARTIAGATPKDLADAQWAVTEALHGQEQAILNLDKAQENLKTVNADATATDIERRQAVLDVQQAQDSLTDSQKSAVDAQGALDKLKTRPSDRDKREALLSVREAQDQVTEATRDRLRQQKDVAAADKAGVDGSEQVVAAQQAIKDANKAVTDAARNLAQAQQAVSDAQLGSASTAGAAAAGAAKLNTAFDALSPPAQAFVRTLISLKPKLDELKATAAAGFFPGATTGLKAAMGSFGSVKKVVGETAAVFGDFAAKLGQIVGSKAFAKDIETIGGRNAKVLATLGEAFRHIITVARNLLVAAGPLTQWLADVANGWALTAARATTAGRENGKLAGFFDKTRAVLERVSSIIGHVAAGLFGMGKASTTSGNQILASIDRAAARFDHWANSVKGQKALQEFFHETKELASALMPVLGGIAKGIGVLALKALPLTEALRLLGPYASQATVAFVAFKIAMAVGGLISGVAGAILSLGAAHRALAAGTTLSTVAQKEGVAATLAAKFAMIATAAASKVMAAAQWVLNAALSANPVGAVVIALAALAAGLVYAYQHCETFRNIVDTTFSWIKDHWVLLLGILTGPIGLATAEIIKNWGAISGLFQDVWNTVKTATSDAWAAVTGTTTGGIASVTQVLRGGMDAVKSTWTTAWTTVRDTAITAFTAVVTGIKALGATFVAAGKWVVDQVLGAIRSTTSAIATVGGWIVNRIADGIKAVGGFGADVGGWIKNRVVDGVQAFADGLKAVGGWITNRVADGLKSVAGFGADVGGWIKNRAVEGVQGAVDGFTNVGSWITNRVADGLKGAGGFAADVGGWLKNRVVDGIHDLKDGFSDVGSWIVSKITDGLKTGADAVVDFINLIIKAINLIPGVPNITPLKHLRAGGTVGADDTPGLAMGGSVGPSTVHHDEFARGGRIGRPMVIVGEEAPTHDEFVIPTNPAYRGRALGLFGDLAGRLGVPGFVSGGINAGSTGGGSGSANVGSTSILGALGDVGSGLVDQLVGLLKDGGKFILKALPGVGSLPDWLKGTGKYALEHATSFITDKVKGLIGDGSDTPSNLAPAARLARMIVKMNEVDAKGWPYVYGGGHGSFEGPYDCSGLVSAILHAGGFISSPMTTDGLKVWGESGDGKAITVGVRGSTGREAHTMMKLGNKYLESGSGHGAKWTSGWAGRGFPIHRHPKGYAEGGILDRLFDPNDPAFVGWGLAQGGTLASPHSGLPYVGAYKNGGVVPQDGMAYVHKGETITPASDTGFDVKINFRDDKLRDLIDVQVVKRERESSAAFDAGVVG